MLRAVFYSATTTGKKRVGTIEVVRGRIHATGLRQELVDQLQSGDLRVIVGPGQRVLPKDGEAFVRGLPYAFHGLYFWAELEEESE